ncbi:hypothetical protein GOODEAATRI_015687, partial [Goodea atripinnis]
EEMASERQKIAELQAELSNAVHLKLEAEGKTDRLELEVQRLNKQLQWHQEQLCSAKEALCCSPKAEQQTANTGPRPDPVEKERVEGLDQVILLVSLGAELKQAQSKLVQVEQKLQTQDAECERHQQKIRELEMQLIRNSTNGSTTASLQEELQAERARLIAADKKVCSSA